MIYCNVVSFSGRAEKKVGRCTVYIILFFSEYRVVSNRVVLCQW